LLLLGGHGLADKVPPGRHQPGVLELMMVRNTTTKRPAAQMTKWLATLLLISACATTVHGQNAIGPLYSPYGSASTDTDAEWFAPVDFDFDNQPSRKSSGYFFRYDKLSWATVGENTTIGDESVNVLSENIFPGNAGDIGAPPPQYQIINGLQEVTPDAEFAWGERYEFGYLKASRNGATGWTVGILDGPERTSRATFGFGPSLNGFGSVHVNFTTSEGYLLGFRDYQIQTINGEGFVIGQNPVLVGPGGDLNGLLTSDGIPDDINGNALPVFFFTGFDADASGDIDDEEVTGNGVDFGDLHEFNIRFDTLLVRDVTETQGIEIMKTHVLNNRHLPASRQGNRWEIAYGARFLRLRDAFFFQGTGDLLGLTQINTSVDNQIVGPQVRAKWSSQRGRWNASVDSRFVFGYNFQDLDQSGDIGQNLVPGGLNSLLNGQPTSFSYGRQANDFSPLVEFRADASYQITRAVALNLGYTAIYVDNVTRASSSTRYQTLVSFKLASKTSSSTA